MATRMPTPKARAAARILGAQISAVRKHRRWTTTRLAEQSNVSLPTLRKIEKGDPSVSIGSVLDAAVAVGVPLFGSDVNRLAEHIEDRIALLPDRGAPIGDEGLDDDF
jgi:transcriptional regulator with XRE-family HTH domain